MIKDSKGNKISQQKKNWYNNWPKGIPKNIKYPEISLFQILKNNAEKYPNKTAIVYFNRNISYKELLLITEKFSLVLNSLNIKKNDKIAIFLPNTPQFLISYFASLKIGAILTTINPLHRERELEYQLEDSETETIILLDLFYPLVEKIWEKTRLKRVIITSLKDYMPKYYSFLGTVFKKIPTYKVDIKPNLYFFKDLLEKKYTAKIPEIRIKPKEDIAIIQYTGGTTGYPKGVMLTHMNLVSNTIMCSSWLRGRIAHEVFLTVLPLSHIYGMTTGMNTPLYLAGKMVLLPNFDPIDILKAIEKNRITVFCGVPTIYAILLQRKDLAKYNLSSIKFCISGSAPLPSEIQKKFMKITGGTLVEGYGLTEASPVTHCNPLDLTMKTVKIGSIGLPWPDTDVKIVNHDGKELKVGKTGEIVIKGPQIMKGYWKKQKETDNILREGWLYTGDIGKMDSQGYFYITDRKKDIIKCKGYSVYPKEIEDLLYEHEAVKCCGVIGIPDYLEGEIPKAFVVLKKGYNIEEEELINFVNNKIAPYKAIRYLEFREKLPLNLIGKVLKRVLREEVT